MTEQLFCDFCGIANPTQEFFCHDFSVDMFTENGQAPTQGSIGSWLACDICTEMINSGDQEALTSRAVLRFLTNNPMPDKQGPEFYRGVLGTVHKTFLQLRVGEPIPIAP